jgi:hypothetical protein
MKIAHLADIHIRLYKREEEYKKTKEKKNIDRKISDREERNIRLYSEKGR